MPTIGNGATSADELARYELYQANQRARAAEGRRRMALLAGSRQARQELAENWAPVTRLNNADDRINGGRGGSSIAPPPVVDPHGTGYPGTYLPTY